MIGIIRKARIFLIRIGKILPFVICGLVFISYAESILATITQDYILYDDYALLRKSISFFIGQYFEYNLQMLFVLVVLSIAIETCVYNKLTCAYLGFNLLEKSYLDFELEPTMIYIICTINIAISGYLTLKGIKKLIDQ